MRRPTEHDLVIAAVFAGVTLLSVIVLFAVLR